MTLRHYDLFSGIGGFALGLRMAGGFETVGFCEIDPYCQRVLAKHWPEVPIHDDIRTLDADAIGPVDVITGGFPCQDISAAGSGEGIDGERSGLWSELFRLIRDVRPRYAILENVPRLLSGGDGAWFGRVLSDLASIRFDAEWDCIPAAAIGAPHERDRVYIVSYPNAQHGQAGLGVLHNLETAIRAARHEYSSTIWLASSCPPARMADGLRAWVDRRERTEALGNAVVPHVVAIIARAIIAADQAREAA